MYYLQIAMVLLMFLIFGCSPQDEIVYDVVIENARVIDPESQADEVLNVAISGDKIAKIIRKYVNEDSLITINTAINKMILMPVKVIESIVPDMKLRARVQEGCYADLLLFELDKVRDNALYNQGFVRSSGMDYVIINGEVLIENGQLRPDVFPGKGIKSDVQL